MDTKHAVDAMRSAGQDSLPDQYRMLVAHSNDAILVRDLDGIITDWNPAAEQLFGYSALDMIGQPITCLVPPEHKDAGPLIQAEVGRGQLIEIRQTRRLKRDGTAIDVSIIIAPFRDATGTVAGAVNIIRDVGAEVRARQDWWQKQNVDSRSLLANRNQLEEKLSLALDKYGPEGIPVALLLVKLERFREIIESHGEDHTDNLLMQAGQHIRDSVHAGLPAGRPVVVARLDGDVFAVLVPNLDESPALQALGAHILEGLRRPIRVADQEETPGGRIGYAVAPRDALGAEDLRQNAELALREAGRLGGNRCQSFGEPLRRAADRRARLKADLRQALELQQLEVHYQPILSLRDGSLRRCEALLRWRHPDHGMVSPAEFIPLAEETGLIGRIGDWVFQTALAQAHSWRERLGTDIQIAVNLSPAQLARFSVNVEEWARLIRESGLPAGTISCEITEGIALDLSPATEGRLKVLREAGMEVAIDDFGLGYFSFGMLKQLRIHRLKIDRSLVQDMDRDRGTLVACQAMVQMAHGMGWTVVAEGVETERQRALAARIGCDYVQGYLVSRPGKPVSVEALMAGTVAA